MNPLVNETARRAAQNYRIVNKDCPWLWAIRNKWYPGGSTQIAVKNGYQDANLLQFLLSRDPEDIELWIRYVGAGGEEEETAYIQVVQIDNAPEWNVNWACKIERLLYRVSQVYDIVIVRSSISKYDDFTIYRIKKGDRYNFREQLSKFSYPDLYNKPRKEKLTQATA